MIGDFKLNIFKISLKYSIGYIRIWIINHNILLDILDYESSIILGNRIIIKEFTSTIIEKFKSGK